MSAQSARNLIFSESRACLLGTNLLEYTDTPNQEQIDRYPLV